MRADKVVDAVFVIIFRKIDLVIAHKVTSVFACAVAARGLSKSRANSPKISPGPSVRSFFCLRLAPLPFSDL